MALTVAIVSGASVGLPALYNKVAGSHSASYSFGREQGQSFERSNHETRRSFDTDLECELMADAATKGDGIEHWSGGSISPADVDYTDFVAGCDSAFARAAASK
ncbi:MAG TPA: hypothetical protein VHD81_10640 [Mycobacteriales bacterium]|nr:hypothetical protein [Mycobacteriales bacterium]